MSELSNILKALDLTSAESALTREEINTEVANLVNYLNPLRQNMPRKKGSTGYAFSVIRRSAPGTTPAGWVTDTTDLDTVIDEGSYVRVAYAYKTIAARGKVTRRLIAEGADLVDVLATELEARSIDFRNTEETGYLVGSSASANQFDSLRYLIPDSQTVNCGAGSTPGSLTLAKLDEAIDKLKGEPDALIMSKKARRELNSLLQANQRYVNYVDIKGARQVLAYTGAPVLVSTVISNAQTWDGMTTADGTGTSTSIYIPRWSEVFVAELTPLTVKVLPPKSSQYTEFDMYCDEVLVMRDYTQVGKLINISTS